MNYENHMSLCFDNNGLVNAYTIFPGINIAFNQIYTNTCPKADSSFYSDNSLIINFCIHGRCEATLSGNKCAIVREEQICISTISPARDFYYPGSLYEGVQLYLDLTAINAMENQNFLSFMGIDLNLLAKMFCKNTGLYIHLMNESLFSLVKHIWETKDSCDYGILRYYTLRLLHEIMDMPCESRSDGFFTRSQISIVKEAENIIMKDLSKRITAKEMADRFGISESSFKLYVKGILGESYLTYFRRKRMEKAAELLTTTNMKIIDIANAVGYENQGKFANVFAKEYGTAPLEFRRLSCRSSRSDSSQV